MNELVKDLLEREMKKAGQELETTRGQAENIRYDLTEKEGTIAFLEKKINAIAKALEEK
jgi:hypothetical protein